MIVCSGSIGACFPRRRRYCRREDLKPASGAGGSEAPADTATPRPTEGAFTLSGMVLNIRNASPLNGYLFECSRESVGAPNGGLTSKHIAIAATGFKAEAAVRKLVPNPDILILIESGPHILKRARELGMQDGEARASLGLRQSLPTRDEREAQKQEKERIQTQAKRLAESQGLKWKDLTADRRKEFRNEAKGARDVGSGATSKWQT